MNRKDEHVSLAKAFHDKQKNEFDFVRVIHNPLPQTAVADVDLSTQAAGFTLSSPFYINAMTGGSEKTKKINQDLAIIAREADLMIATGSVSAALKDPSLADTYTIMRQEYPHGKIIANIGAGTSVERAQEAIRLFHADALQIHLNAPQELVMPEGDRDFTNWKALIQEIQTAIDVPLIVKEVGFGMTRETINDLASLGVHTVDISGRSGTSFTQIENARRSKRELNYLADWGQSTVASLLEANETDTSMEILASGGIRNAYDIFKALCLGAKAVGTSGTVLTHLMNHGVEETIMLMKQWQEELRLLYTMVGATNTASLHQQSLIFSGPVKDWCEARGIHLVKYGRRTEKGV
ncbi:type 2 isopentenyl-diphosphate Delta-isomerase [Enterococcus faecium]|uniref:type 2 isopentenyl-diphosphate Delta-isomerase n=1 Tax=Enterococcus TaxID=1350 RepID=UPI000A3590AC|nr:MULTISPECIES: type 2 isopentenyl-diphosphate Delta-isomerase [Enterococcus]EGP4882709.1 type 2 isopentenyl-diphosphate Delta-isomerase [Enterococcus faecium]EGP4954227.1 type 2 isopentenyl-diphosphate Delta-isomerase [Enterococcus faecium]EGP4975230.1 type 2 isopentenyl-diphosphate Delta-isomerase [Enterococcus faecium]EGP5033066.1 type 2 isopentenyl-diphosphate Delta-isomerase [Enterococcus faecium]EGP5148231.1 type 2 isopentenyl-diphosphate Delta-isomerase [Enterococcus faecium]